jgi:hypothetical protein
VASTFQHSNIPAFQHSSKGNRLLMVFSPGILSLPKSASSLMHVPKKILIELQYLPPVQYFSKFALHEAVRIEQYEHYQKRSYRNRSHMAGPNGVLRLSIPLCSGKNEQQPIREVLIAGQEAWQRRHWQSIRTAYGNAPFFEFYADALQPFYERPYKFLFDFNRDLLYLLLDILDLPGRLEWTGAFDQTPPEDTLDFRDAIRPQKKESKPDPYFHPVRYQQVFEEKNGFLANLSILDLLFCSGPQAPLILKECIVNQ